MNSIADQSTERRFNIAFITLFCLLFLAAPSYYQDNSGGEGLFLPFNNIVWLCVSFIIATGFLKILHTNRFHQPGMLAAMLIFLATTTFLGIYNSVTTPVAWLFRSLAIWGGVLFFIALSQFRLDQRCKETLLLIIMLSAAVQSGYGLVQILLTDPLPGWLPQSPGVPRGIFQQQNLNASYAATGFLIATHLLLSSSFQARNGMTRLLPYAAGALTISTIVTAGSRIGILGVALGVVLLLACNTNLLRRSRQALLVFLLVVFSSGYGSSFLETSTGGLNAGFQKLNAVTEHGPTQGNIRVMIYDSSLQLVLEKPLFGYGIGQFESIWHSKKAEYLAENPGTASLQPRLSHPHNELLYWGIEGGVVALTGILVMVVTFLWIAFRSDWRQGGSALALLLPVALHTQVELPFYISQLHWILFLVLIAITSHQSDRIRELRLSRAAKVLSLSLVLGLPVVTTIFSSHSLASINSTIRFITAKEKDIRSLEFPSKNLYFNRHIALLQMQILLQVGIGQNNEEILQRYTKMATEHLKVSPDTRVFGGLSLAYHKLQKYDLSHQVMARALAIYPDTPEVLAARNQLMQWDRDTGIFDQYWRSTPIERPQ